MGREGSLVVPPKLTPIALTKISLCDATGKGSQRHSFRYAALLRLYPCSITGAAELGYLLACSPVQLGGPFDFCAFALLSPLSLGSLEIALKCTRPRQRFYYVGRYSMTEGGCCQEEYF